MCLCRLSCRIMLHFESKLRLINVAYKFYNLPDSIVNETLKNTQMNYCVAVVTWTTASSQCQFSGMVNCYLRRRRCSSSSLRCRLKAADEINNRYTKKAANVIGVKPVLFLHLRAKLLAAWRDA